MNSVNEKIFRAYDIRGTYPDEINEKAAYQIGLAFAAYVRESGAEQIVAGHDARLSSPVLARSFIRGVVDAGINVLNIGLVTVDMVYFASRSMHLPAAMITASHNPKEYNGFKFMRKDADLMGLDSGLSDIKKLIEEKLPIGQTGGQQGAVVEKSIENEYLKHVLRFAEFDYIRPMKIAIDASSGSAGRILKKVLGKLPVEYAPLHFNPDGNFPYHEPDPKKEKNLLDLKNEMIANHYYFGCAFDGDGDRIIFVDEKGNYISPSVIGAIMARYFLGKTPYGKVVYTADASQIIPETVNIYGGEAIREKVGHTNINKRLRMEKGILGIETSGHYFFKDNFYADSGIISLIVMMDILSRQKKSLSLVVPEFSKYVSISEINLKIDNPEEFIKKIAQNFEGYEIDWFDGLTVRTADFWLNLRPSNTEPVIRLNIEAKNELILQRVKKDTLGLVKKFNQ